MKDFLNSRPLNVILDFAILFILAWGLSAKDITGSVTYELPNPFMTGFIQGLVAPFMYILTWFTTGKTACAGYIIEHDYWAGYAVGIFSIFIGTYYQIAKIYQYKKEHKNVKP